MNGALGERATMKHGTRTVRQILPPFLSEGISWIRILKPTGYDSFYLHAPQPLFSLTPLSLPASPSRSQSSFLPRPGFGEDFDRMADVYKYVCAHKPMGMLSWCIIETATGVPARQALRPHLHEKHHGSSDQNPCRIQG